ncbi:MAG: hypothetical protein R2941_17175 [Desulfobacterales bacterium]
MTKSAGAEGLEMMLEDTENRCIMVAECQKKVVGMCSVQLLISTAEGGPAGLVEDLAVLSGLPESGNRQTLLKSTEKWATEKAHPSPTACSGSEYFAAALEILRKTELEATHN